MLFRWSLILFVNLLAATAFAQEDSQPAGRVSIAAHSGLISRHRPGAWTVLGIAATNSTTTDQDAIISCYLAPHVERQFARRLWMPAESRRMSWLPIQVPPDLVRQVEHLDLISLSIDGSDGQEVLQRRGGEQLTSELFLAIDHNPGKTAFYARKPEMNEDNLLVDFDDDAFDTLLVSRVSVGRSHTATALNHDFLPPHPDALQGFDYFVLAADRIRNDAAGLASLRSWVQAGGRLWIMLDRVDRDTVFALVGNAVAFEVVDRVEVDQFQLEALHESGTSSKHSLSEYEVPVDFVRVLCPKGEVSHRLNDWPAAIWLPYGEGEILMTTLGPRGWRDEAGSATAALEELADRFYSERLQTPDAELFQPVLHEQIGYRAPPRTFAVGLLLGYCGVLGGAWFTLSQRSRHAWLAVIAPAITLVFAGFFYGIGRTNAATVPATIAAAQLVQCAPETNEARVTGLMAVYDKQSRPVAWQTTQRGWIVPPRETDVATRRQVWSDADGMEIQNASTVAEGVRVIPFATQRSFSEPVRAVARFGPQGIEGELFSGELKNLADLVIAAPPAPSLALVTKPDGTFIGRPEDVLAAGQYSADMLLSDDQQRRLGLYRELFRPTNQRVFPRQPQLAFWCRPVTVGVSMPEGFVLAESALAMVPIEIQPTPPQTRFAIPATFLKVDDARRGTASGSSIAYQARTGQWLKGLDRPAETALHFQLPPQVLPCSLDLGQLVVRMNAPLRKFSVWAVRDGEPLPVGEAVNPNGVLHFQLDASHLQFDQQGRVELRFYVEDPSPSADQGAVGAARSANTAPWQIEYVRLTVSGQTL